MHRVTVDLVKLDRTAVKSDHLTTLPEEKSTKIISSSERAMGCSASRADGLEHEEALQHVIQMMRELKVKQIANIAARREGRRSREKYYGWAGVQGARAIAGGDAVLRRASIAHANWRRGGPVTVAIAPGTLLDLPSDVTDTILDFLLEVSEKRDLSLGVQPRLDEEITPATVQRWRRESYSTSASVLRRNRRAVARALRLDPRREFQSSAHVGPAIAIARDVVVRDLYVLPAVGQPRALRRGHPRRDLWTKLNKH